MPAHGHQRQVVGAVAAAQFGLVQQLRDGLGGRGGAQHGAQDVVVERAPYAIAAQRNHVAVLQFARWGVVDLWRVCAAQAGVDAIPRGVVGGVSGVDDALFDQQLHARMVA